MAWEHKGIIEKPRIALLMPFRENLNAFFVESVWGPLRFIWLPWCDKIPKMGNAPSLPLVRNTLAEQALALEPKVTHLLWVDSDGFMESPLDVNVALRVLYECNAPIAGCLYVAKQKSGFNYAAWLKSDKGYRPITEWTGNWIPVDVTGMHFCLIKREVFENVPKPWFHWESEGDVSEDFYFFEKAKKAGYQVRIHTDVRLSHFGTLKIKTDKSITTVTG